MDWVEVTGTSVEEATERALDQLGVDEADAEVEVLAEAKTGLFGKLREEARVRARVRPTTPRAKDEGRERRRRTGKAAEAVAPAPAAAPIAVADEADSTSEAAPAARGRGAKVSEQATAPAVPVGDQAAVAKEFLDGLLSIMGLSGRASSTVHVLDEDTAEVRIDGDELGLLIGPKGATLLAVQDLARTVVQRRTGARQGRLLVDVAGYRQKRKEALERFTAKVASEVLASQTAAALEPMSSADRKIVHDTANAIEGVATSSEGEEPRRRVVIRPA
jgi:spoIIIJ-associated protein